MTQKQQLRATSNCSMIIIAAKELLKIASELNDNDVDTAILIADSVRSIANGNCAIIDQINGVTNSLDAEVNLEQSFEDFKKTLSVSIPYCDLISIVCENTGQEIINIGEDEKKMQEEYFKSIGL